ncbi:ABC transporter substrate-binding protein/permease [Paucilactobacillus sp. N302-9]
MKKLVHLFLVITLLFTSAIGVMGAFTDSASAAKTDPYVQKIKKKGYITVGLSADYPPYEFHKTINGKDEIVGFDISVAKKIAKDMGVKLRIDEMSFDSLLGALKTGKIDMIISGMSNTPERAKEVTFSKTYLSVQQKILIRKEDAKKYKTTADFNNVKVGAQKQTTQEDLAKTQLTGAKVTSLEKFTDLVLQLENSKIDAIVAEDPVGAAYVSQNSSLKLITPGFANSTKNTAVALPKNSPALTAAVNKSIDQIKSQKLMPKYQKKAVKQMFSKQSFLQEYGSYYVKGAWYTVALAAIGVFIGTILGTALAMMRRSKAKILKWLSIVYIEYLRGTPLLVQVFIVFFGTQMIGLHVSAFVSGALAMGLNSGAYVAEIIRGGLNSVDVGQNEAARSLGLKASTSMRFVVLPQAFKSILPALGNEFIAVIKESSIVSVVGVGELMFQTGVIQGASFKPFVPLIFASLIYFILTFGLTRILSLLEKHYNLSSKSNLI